MGLDVWLLELFIFHVPGAIRGVWTETTGLVSARGGPGDQGASKLRRMTATILFAEFTLV